MKPERNDMKGGGGTNEMCPAAGGVMAASQHFIAGCSE